MTDIAELTRTGQMGALNATGAGDDGHQPGVLGKGPLSGFFYTFTGTPVTDTQGALPDAKGIFSEKADGFSIFRQTKSDAFIKGLTNVPNSKPEIGGSAAGGGLEMASVSHEDIAAPSSSWAAVAASSRDNSSDHGIG